MEYFDAMCDPDRVVEADFARKLERERDEARFDLEFRRRLGDQQNETINDIANARDEARDAAQKAKAYKRVLKETNAQLKRERDEARGQRDRLAEALEQIIEQDDMPMSIRVSSKSVARNALQSLTPNEKP